MAPRQSRSYLCASAMLAAVAVWLWPLGLGGRMPVGGDVTSFSMGLMAFLHDALREGRLPVWNDLWGYGFPGLAESQMGVYYPPHWLLYGLLPVEAAYTASLVVHTAWAALGAFWAARRFGSSATGAALAGFTFSTCGFFLIHLPHQWGYTTGCWMPWAWGMAWTVARGEGTLRNVILLATVLTLQVLPGHFQLAFYTEAGVLVIAVWALGERAAARSVEVRGPLLACAALAAVLPLGAAQLWPTLRLARLAATQRDYEYLSGFASTPLHLISYVAPRLFHGSALWRPLVWDPFHTSPEEHLAYVGLVPLLLAGLSVFRSWRRDGWIRLLTALAVVTLILSLGPYVPGFALWCRVPGFSFFRASSRWSLGTALALSLLAANGFDLVAGLARPARVVLQFVAASVLAAILVVGSVELAVRATEGRGWTLVTQGFDRLFQIWPWSDRPNVRSLGRLARSYHPNLLLSYAREEARDGRSLDLFAAAPRFVDERLRIYGRELGTTAALLVGLIVLAAAGKRPRAFRGGLAVLTLLDLWALGQHRAVDVAPIRPLGRQSPTLARLAKGPRGTRVVTPAQNLPIVVGAAPLRGYRTLDLAALPALTNLAYDVAPSPRRQAALRATGTGIRVFDGLEQRAGDREPGESVSDPALASWLFGSDLVATQGDWFSRFLIWKPVPTPARAWRLAATGDTGLGAFDSPNDEVGKVLALFKQATPLVWRSIAPTRVEVNVESKGPDVVIVSQLADPQWRARWVGKTGERDAEIRAVFRAPGQGGWQAIRVPEPGTWTLRLEYDARDVRQGLAVSGVSWLFVIGAVVVSGRRERDSSNEGQRT
ncbi:MAG: hypothetical protein P4L84_25905 [Isosphaeraceae bacterium]|nr:hypothetical protein [Isosphaeraceae bacterium]